jgi:hypothetical protein
MWQAAILEAEQNRPNGLLADEGSQKQLQAFSFQRLAALAERYQEAD